MYYVSGAIQFSFILRTSGLVVVCVLYKLMLSTANDWTNGWLSVQCSV